MGRNKILIVEDEQDISEMIAYNLEKEGFETALASDGEDALPLARSERPDLVVLDVMLPGMDGLEICRAIRRDPELAHLPVIMLTARAQETDKIVGLELGADDYITKPFSPKELVARIRAILRRVAKPRPASAIRAGVLEVDPLKHRASLEGEPLALTSTEFGILHYLASRPGEAVTRQTIIMDVLGYSADVYDRTVDTHIKTLRKKLGPARGYIETVRGKGYRFREL